MQGIDSNRGGTASIRVRCALVFYAVNIWVMNNWQEFDSCFGKAPEALSTRCGGQGVTDFYGMAKPVRAPQIGPARGYD